MIIPQDETARSICRTQRNTVYLQTIRCPLVFQKDSNRFESCRITILRAAAICAFGRHFMALCVAWAIPLACDLQHMLRFRLGPAHRAARTTKKCNGDFRASPRDALRIGVA